MTLPPQTLASTTLSASLAERGWATHFCECTGDDAVIDELSRISALLGTRTEGRTPALEEVIQPQSKEAAHPRSLSALYGLNALPFHAELSHRPSPCRYLLLGCIDPGFPSATTMLLDWRSIGFSSDELRLLEAAPVFVRAGRRSFYSTLLPPDHRFLRYDPGCIEAVDNRGRNALRIVEHRLDGAHPLTHAWRRGGILVIDNWRILHGRGPSDESSGRRLARILIDA
jgi:Taurine catabolism dioxygenase TauD, TfdA family